MSRVAKKPIQLPKEVELTVVGSTVKAKGPQGVAELVLHSCCELIQESDTLVIQPIAGNTNNALPGTMRALLNNLVIGVYQGFQKKLILSGVGYRAQAQGSALNLSLGFSHPVVHVMPEGVTCETPSQTEIIIKGINKQVVGEVAAKIRAYRPPEPYKGKGIRYSDEVIVLKEVKKK